jgi:uncharacterized membrane protein YidH (DUF202 family)
MSGDMEPSSSNGGEQGARHDSGLARERTELAWSRTAISFAAVGVAILRTDHATGALVIAMTALVWFAGRSPAHERADGRHGSRLGRRRAAQLITAATCLVSLVALVLAVRPVLLHPLSMPVAHHRHAIEPW